MAIFIAILLQELTPSQSGLYVYIAEPHRYAVPELFFNEMLAVFCRLLSDASKIKEYMHILERLGMERIGNGSQLFERAAEIAKEFQISGCDAIFAAASLVKGVWLTADKAAVKKLRALILLSCFRQKETTFLKHISY